MIQVCTWMDTMSLVLIELEEMVVLQFMQNRNTEAYIRC